MKRNRKSTRPSAFTLIELLLVLVILAVLAGVVVPKFANRSEQARITAAKTDVAAISTALDAFEIDNGRYPTADEGLMALIQQPGNLTNWQGPYLKRSDVPKDPWGNPYIYVYPGSTGSDYELYSYGPDGREGGDDDISSH